MYKNRGQNKYQIIKKSREKSAKKSKKKIKQKDTLKKERSKKRKKAKVKKKSVIDRYKNNLQGGYVITVNSLIYKQSDFDAEQIFYLKYGTKVLMSKKIFVPPHRFGTFYKVFIKKPKKVVGYISEVDVIPEFVRLSKNQFNPKYQKLEKQLKEHGTFNLASLSQQKEKNFSESGMKPSMVNSSIDSLKSKRYLGFSVGGRYDYGLNWDNILFGVKVSGKNLFLSNIEMDINLNISSLSFYHIDMLAGYPLLAGYKYVVYIMGGLKVDIANFHVSENKANSVPYLILPNFGPVGSLSFVLPFQDKFSLRVDLKMEYGFLEQKMHVSSLATIQVGF